MSVSRLRLVTLSTLVTGTAIVAVVPTQLAAQEVQYETVTTAALPGALGTAMRLAARLGGGSTEVVEQTSIKGSRMRVDSEGSSTITDLENGRVIFLDHAERTYSAFTLDELMERARETGEAMQEADRERSESGSGDAAARLEFRVSVDDARERERIAGYDARRFFLTMEAASEYVPEEGDTMEEGGTLVVLTDMWASEDIPVFAARQEFDQVSAREYAEAGAAVTEGLAAAFADDPQLRVAFERSAEEVSRIEGMPVRTVLHFVVVQPGRQFDREAITNPRPVGGAAVAQQAVRAGLGRLAGRLGGRQQPAEPEATEEPSQSVLMTVTTEIRNVRTSGVEESLFEVPAGYREVTPEG